MKRLTTAPVQGAQLAIFAAIALCIFMPYIIDVIVSPQIVILAACVAFVLLECAREARAWRLATALIAYLAVAFLGVQLLAEPGDVSAGRLLFMLAPAVLVMARLIVLNPDRAQFLSVLVLVGAANAALGLIEKLTAGTLFGRVDLLMDDGGGKAIVAADHPLVLGALLAITVALVPLSSLPARPLFAVLLTVGAWATNAAAPTAVALLALVTNIPVVSRALQRFWWVVAAGISVAFGVLFYFAYFVWSTFIPSTDLNAYSIEFRMAMYSLMPEILAAAPFGYGPGGAPEGMWILDSAYRGPRDLAIQIDSELMFLVVDFGWMGLLLFVLSFVAGIIALRRSGQIGVASVAASGLGFVLSLHAWGSTLTIWLLILALAMWWVVGARRVSTEASSPAD